MLLSQKSVYFYCKLALTNQGDSDPPVNYLSINDKTAHCRYSIQNAGNSLTLAKIN